LIGGIDIVHRRDELRSIVHVELNTRGFRDSKVNRAMACLQMLARNQVDATSQKEQKIIHAEMHESRNIPSEEGVFILVYVCTKISF
jgi:hypothetical protein